MMDMLNITYWYFVMDVAENRNMTFEEVVDKSSNGTIIIGKQAYDLGFIDYLGDLDTAISIASELADISYPETQIFTKSTSFTDMLSWIYPGVDLIKNRFVLKV